MFSLQGVASHRLEAKVVPCPGAAPLPLTHDGGDRHQHDQHYQQYDHHHIKLIITIVMIIKIIITVDIIIAIFSFDHDAGGEGH